MRAASCSIRVRSAEVDMGHGLRNLLKVHFREPEGGRLLGYYTATGRRIKLGRKIDAIAEG
jgi:hypothetical protein